MANNDITEILRNLKEKDPKVRRKAIQQLAKTDNTDVINDLVMVYKTDPDDNVVAEAKKALSKFKGQDPDLKPEPPKALTRARIGLAGLLVLLIVANVAFMFLGGSDDDSEADQSPRDREEILVQVVDTIEQVDSSANRLREVTNSRECGASIKIPNPVTLSDSETETYPDIESVIGEETSYRIAIDTLPGIRDFWKLNCDAGTLNVENQNAINSQLDSLVLDRLQGIRENVTTLGGVFPTPVPEESETE